MKSNVYYIGDSWNKFSSKIKNDIANGWYLMLNGAGIEKIWHHTKDFRKQADITIFTIPGMIRSVQFMKGGIKPENMPFNSDTHKGNYFWARKFYGYMKSNPNFLDEFLSYYYSLLTQYYEEQENLVYFIFNTGGWPYRHPYNMAYHGIEDFEQTMLDWFEESGMRYTYLNLQGQKGMCELEEDAPDKEFVERFGREYFDKQLGWKVPACYSDIDMYPKDTIILDHHPSHKAQEIAVQHINDYLIRNFEFL